MVATVALLVSERLPPAATMLGAVTILLAARVIDAGHALSGFSNPAPFTVAALMVLAGAADVTGALDPLTERAMRGRLARVLVPTAGASAFLNNTPIVAMIAPRVAAFARRAGRPASRYLMPVSFAAILGGIVTLIGTSTTVVVSGLLEAAGDDPLTFFEITPLGLPIAAAGLVLLATTASRLLPARRSPTDALDADAREFTVEMVVADTLAGRSVAEAGLRNLDGVFLVEVERDGHTMSPVGPDEVLAADDRLTFAGNVGRVLDLERIPGLRPVAERHFSPAQGRFFEAVVSPGGALAGRTLKEIGFRGRYGAAVVAIHRAGERVGTKLGSVPLRPGDVLLLLAQEGFRRRPHEDFLLVAPIGDRTPLRPAKAWVVFVVGAAFVASAATGVLGLLEASLLAAVALVVAGVLTPDEARVSVDLDVIVLIGASFGVGEAIGASGLASTVADGITGTLGSFGDLGLLVGVLVATAIVTELVTNNAAAVLMFPVATATASAAGLNPRPFAIAVALAASASFLTPVGYQTNTMVYGMGGYRFGDFARLGAPLTLLVIAGGTVLIPLIWPL